MTRIAVLYLVFSALIAWSYAASAQTAAEYYEPIAPEVKRDTKWREKLTLNPESVSAKELKDMLPGDWLILHSCSGRPVTKLRLEIMEKIKGVRIARVLWRFLDGTRFQRIILPDAPGDTRAGVREQGTYTTIILDDRNGILKLLESGTYQDEQSAFTEVRLQLRKIKETGEIVLVNDSDQLNKVYEGFCNEGERFEYIYAKVPSA